MAIKKSGLGKGLESVFLENSAPDDGGTNMIRIADIQPRKDQPRKHFDMESLQSLSDSIGKNGLLQPVAVRESPGGFYELIAGERRWRAAKMAGLHEIPAVVLTADDRAVAELALIENLQREDLNPIEVGAAYKQLRDAYGLTQEELGRIVGKSRSAVANSLRLLDLPPKCRELVAAGKIPEGHAKVLLGVADEKKMIAIAEAVAEKELRVRETEVLVKKANKMSNDDDVQIEEPGYAPTKVNYTKALEEKAGRLLGRRVCINGRGKTKRLELYFEDKEDLETLLAALCGRRLYEDEI